MEEKRIPSMLLSTLLTQIDETMGRRSLIRLLRQADLSEYADRLPPLTDTPSITVGSYSRLLAHVYSLFGAQGARVLFESSGRQNAAELRRQRPTQFAVVGTALRLLPNARRMRIALDRLAEQGREIYDASCLVAEEEEAFIFAMPGCPFCAEISKQTQERGQPPVRPVCHLPASTIGEMMEWATGQKHLVEEIACIALGAPSCRFRIGK